MTPTRIGGDYRTMVRCPRCHHLNPPAAAACDRCGVSMKADVPPDGAAVAGAELAPGLVVDGRYEIEALIGRGGMAVVYAAVDRRLKRRVALKILGSELLHHPTARARMETEAAALARVVHPNVLQIYNVFDHAGLLVLELELVTGGTLATKIPRGGMPAADAVRVMSAILSGLAAIHAEGLVHRDIKPGNILMMPSGVPKIADLGVARDALGRGATKTGALLGTPAYMSPEQSRARPDQPVDARSDVYACGIVLYEMLAGAAPFDSDSDFDLMAAQVNDPPDFGRIGADVPAEVVGALRRALEKDPGRRWHGADDFAEGLLPNAAPAASPEPRRSHIPFPGATPHRDTSVADAAGPGPARAPAHLDTPVSGLIHDRPQGAETTGAFPRERGESFRFARQLERVWNGEHEADEVNPVRLREQEAHDAVAKALAEAKRAELEPEAEAQRP